MAVVPEPHNLKRLWIGLFLILVAVIIISAFLPAERTVKGVCLIEASQRWTLSELRPGTFESRATDLAADRLILYRLFQFDRPSFMDMDFSGLEEGQIRHCEAGQIVARVNASSLELELAERGGELEEARARLAGLNAGAKPEELDQARIGEARAAADLDAWRAQAQRQERLFADGIISEEQWEETRSELRLKELSLELARAEYRVLNSGAREVDLEAERVRIRGLENELLALGDLLAAQTIHTPIAGRLIQGGDEGVILSAANLDSVVVHILLPQQIGTLPQVGLPFTAHIPGVGEIEGRVIRMDRRAMQTRIGSFLSVYGIVDNPDHALEEGMQGRASLHCGQTSLLDILLGDLLEALGVHEGPVQSYRPLSKLGVSIGN